MAVEDGLDLDRGDVLAGAADHVLLAVDEVQVAVRIARHDIAGVQPAAVPRFSGRLRILQVLAEKTVEIPDIRASLTPGARPNQCFSLNSWAQLSAVVVPSS